MGTTNAIQPNILAILRHADIPHRIIHYCDHAFLHDSIAQEFWDADLQIWRYDGVLSDVADMLEMQAYYRCDVIVLRGDANDPSITKSGT
jgi:hypothetical protein